MILGAATAEGTARFAGRFPEEQRCGFYRCAAGWTISSLGIGTYLGAMDDDTTRGYKEAIEAALRGGINVIDTSLNYRNQRSEHAVERALGALIGGGELKRDEVVVCTKAGYLVPNAVPVKALGPRDIVGNMHSMAPVFLEDQLARSLRNLGLSSVDVFYLHNPETQLRFLPELEFYEHIREAFVRLEKLVAQGRIAYYGAATWDGFRSAERTMSVARLASLAAEAGGEHHHFRFIQLPFNLAMAEAFTKRNQDGKTALEAAVEAGISVVASASLLQARLARDLPPEVAGRLKGFRTDAQRALQFTRSTPGIAVALAGMGRREHVAENLALSQVEPAARDEYMQMYSAD